MSNADDFSGLSILYSMSNAADFSGLSIL
jgi:hypothetical protein